MLKALVIFSISAIAAHCLLQDTESITESW